jgi:hypothetical protein
MEIPFGAGIIGQMRSVHLMVTTGSGPQADWIKLNYKDGTCSYHNVFSHDRFLDFDNQADQAVGDYISNVTGIPNVAARSRIAGWGSELENLYDITLTPDTGKEVISISLPPHSGLTYTAITVEKAVLGMPETVPPVVKGAVEGNIYYKRDGDITLHFNKGTAKLNGKEFINGGIINATGDYTLIVTDEFDNCTAVNFTYITYGDVNGDGLIDMQDLSLIKANLLGTKQLDAVYKKAGDLYSENTISLNDLVGI